MIACFLSNISAKYYKNPSMLSRVTAKSVGDVFLRHSVVRDLLRVSRACRQQVREEVMRKSTTLRGSYEELVPVEFGLNILLLLQFKLTRYRHPYVNRFEVCISQSGCK